MWKTEILNLNQFELIELAQQTMTGRWASLCESDSLSQNLCSDWKVSKFKMFES